jgi:predicted acylesterase/phospholipase RssA
MPEELEANGCRALDKNNVRVCLSAGGIKGPVHAGVLDRLAMEPDLRIVEVAGASVAAIVAAFYTNGYPPQQIASIFTESLSRRSAAGAAVAAIVAACCSSLYRSPAEAARALTDAISRRRDLDELLGLLPDPISFMLGGWMNPTQYLKLYDFTDWSNVNRFLSMFDPVSLAVGGWLDLRPSMRKMCDRYRLKPNLRLTIYVCDILRNKLVKFSGVDYDLADILSAACGLPGLFRPVWHFGDRGWQLLGDAARYHYSPPDHFADPAIFSVFEPATEMPEKGALIDRLFGAPEVLHLPLAGDNRYVDPKKHLVISTKPKWPGLFMDIDAGDVGEMVSLGFEAADSAIANWRAAGRI